MDYITGGKLIVDAVKEIRAILNQRKGEKASLIEVGDLLSLFGICLSIKGYGNKLAKIENLGPQLSYEDRNTLGNFIQVVEGFIHHLNALNLSLLDIYYPGFSLKIASSFDVDTTLIRRIRSALGDREFHKITGDVPNIIKLLEHDDLRGLADLSDLGNLRYIMHYGYSERDMPKNTKPQLLQLVETIDQCRELIGDIIRDNWDFKEIAESKAE